MDGSDSPRTQSVRAFARNLAPLDLPILLWDERWSTQAVERAMIDADVSRAKRAEKGRRPRRRAHPAGRDRRAGQSCRARLGVARGPAFDRLAERRRRSRRSSTRASAGSTTTAGRAATPPPRRPDRLQPVLRKLDPDLLMSFAIAAHRLGAQSSPCRSNMFGEEGRDARRHRADPQRDAARRAGHPPRRQWRAGAMSPRSWTAR